MRNRLFLLLFLTSFYTTAQVRVATLMSLDASGGVTTDQRGNLYISDFGAMLGMSDTTAVYKWNPRNGQLTNLAEGFLGASGACFDQDGYFYQSNPHGNRISRVAPDGTVELDWWTEQLNLPVGLEAIDGDIFVCNCSGNSIGRISDDTYQEITSDLLKCPNGLTQDDQGNLYACNFANGHILKIDKEHQVSVVAELPVLTGGPNPVGNGHLVWKNGWLFVTTIGTGEVFRVGLDGNYTRVAGKAFAFTNLDGAGTDATFNKPNGIDASPTGDTLYVNVSDPTWISDPRGLHPAHIRMITGVCELEGAMCPDRISFTSATLEPADPELLHTQEIRTLYEDTDGRIWMGSKSGILVKEGDDLFRLKGNYFQVGGTISILEDSDGAIWFAGRGLYCFKDNMIESFPDQLTGNRVNFSLFEGRNLTVSGSNGVFHVADKKVFREGDGTGDYVVHDYAAGTNGDYWLATRKNGLMHVDGQWYPLMKGENCRKLLDDGDFLWVGTSTGLFKVNKKTSATEQLSGKGVLIPEQKLEDGSVLCSSESLGLIRVKNGKLRSLGENVLAGRTVYTALASRGKVWVGTDKGVVVVDLN